MSTPSNVAQAARCAWHYNKHCRPSLVLADKYCVAVWYRPRSLADLLDIYHSQPAEVAKYMDEPKPGTLDYSPYCVSLVPCGLRYALGPEPLPTSLRLAKRYVQFYVEKLIASATSPARSESAAF